jgi:hypothetical protein
MQDEPALPPDTIRDINGDPFLEEHPTNIHQDTAEKSTTPRTGFLDYDGEDDVHIDYIDPKVFSEMDGYLVAQEQSQHGQQMQDLDPSDNSDSTVMKENPNSSYHINEDMMVEKWEAHPCRMEDINADPFCKMFLQWSEEVQDPAVENNHHLYNPPKEVQLTALMRLSREMPQYDGMDQDERMEDLMSTLIDSEIDYETILWVVTDAIRVDPWPDAEIEGNTYSHVYQCAYVNPNDPRIPEITEAIGPTWLAEDSLIRNKVSLPHFILDVARHQHVEWQTILKEILETKNLRASQEIYKERVVDSHTGKQRTPEKGSNDNDGRQQAQEPRDTMDHEGTG